MNDQVLWGVLLIIYVVPFWLWQTAQYSKIKACEQLYPGRPDEKRTDSRVTSQSLVWCVGLVALLAVWRAGWHPIGTSIVLAAAVGVFFLARAAIKKWQLLAKRWVRLWLAGFVVWLLTVAAWYLIFGRVSRLDEEEFFLLAALPPVVAAVGIVVWRWARQA